MGCLSGKAAVVTGGGGVLCGAFSHELARHGAAVAVLDQNPELARQTADAIVQRGGRAIAVVCDVLNMENLYEAKEKVKAAFGRWDILINGAGGNHPRATATKEYYEEGDEQNTDPNIVTFFDLDLKGFEFVFSLNFMGTLLPTQVFAKEMAAQKSGTILNVTSMAAPCPMTKVPAYAAAKAGISNFTQYLAVYFANAGIRVNAIAPGFFVTGQNEKLLMNPDGSLTSRSQKIINHTPMRRFGQPEELLGTLIWLCDESASGFVTGSVINVDGGFMAYSGV